MELQYEELNCYSCVLDTVIRREESRESIVPDSMPDIGTVLTVTASPMLHKTWIENGAVIVEGSICAAVLYEPEGGGGPCALPLEIPFRCAAECEALTEECRLNILPRLSRADVKVVNPRKVLVQAELSAHVIAYTPRTMRYSTGIADADASVQTKTESVSFRYVSQVTEKMFPFEDDVTIGGSRPPIDALLACNVTPYCSEAKIVGTKILFKGGLKLRIRAQNEEQGLFSELCDIPVSQVLDAGDSSESAVALVSLFLAGCQIVLRDSRTLSLELELYACATVVDNREGNVLSDAYSTRCACQCEEVIERNLQITEQIFQPHPFRALLQQELPAADVVDLCALLGENAGTIEEGRRCCTLRLSVCLREQDGRLTHLAQTAEVELPVAADGILLGSVTLLECSCLSSAAGLEVRGNLMVQCIVLAKREIRYVGAVTLEETDPSVDRPSAVLRRLKKGETLWDLGKEYYATVADILAVNQISDESAAGERFLLIPHGR